MYERHQGMYDAALSLSSVTAPILAAPAEVVNFPWAWAVPPSIAVCVSNPEGMERAATAWTRAPAEPLPDLDELLSQARQVWEGDAFDEFSARIDEFRRGLTDVASYREAMARTLRETAAVFGGGARLALVVAIAMAACAAWKSFAEAVYGVAYSAEVLFARGIWHPLATAVRQLATTARRLAVRLAAVVAIAGGVLGLASLMLLAFYGRFTRPWNTRPHGLPDFGGA